MNANELADMLWENYLDNNECEHGFALSSGCHNDDCKEQALYDAATMLRQQQAEIEALKKTCLDEITKRVYADQTTKVMEGYWEEAQEEIERLKVQYGICEDKAMTTFTTQDRQDVQRTPLTDELIKDIQAMCHLKNVGYDTFIMRFARAIERAHGIGE